MEGVKGLAVVIYAESLTTQQVRRHRLSQRVNNRAIMMWVLDLTKGGSAAIEFSIKVLNNT